MYRGGGYVVFEQDAIGYEERGRDESHQSGRIVDRERVDKIVHLRYKHRQK